jgi:FAD/FMN-containing dehydrogenase
VVSYLSQTRCLDKSLICTGGISFFSGRHGLACDNVISFEIVLPSGEITIASESSHPELYKALRGAGSSNFGIVASFHMSTIPLPNAAGLWSNLRTYSWDKVPALRKARLEWVTSGVDNDFDTGGYEVFGFAGMYNMSMALVQHFHTKHASTTSWPAVFSKYKDLEPLPMEGADLQRIHQMSDITEEISKLNVNGRRNTYATFTYQPTEELDTALFKIFEEGLEKAKHIPGIVAFMPLQPLSRHTISQMSHRGGNSLGLKESDSPLVVYLQSWQWDNEADDALIFKTTKDILRKSEKVAKEMGLWHRYKYINYAEEWQAEDIYSGYGEDNLKQLRALQRKLDPEGVFTKGGLCGGYFRLNAKPVEAERGRDEL